MSVPHLLLLLPKPLPSGTRVVGQLVTNPNPVAKSTLEPTTLGNRDFDDTHMTAWYKDIVAMNQAGELTASLGGSLFLERPAEGTQLLSLEAENTIVRALKDTSTALKTVCSTPEAQAWLRQQVQAGEDVYFVSAVQEAKNASFKRASVIDAGNGLVKVSREIEQTGQGGVRRDSGLEVPTGTKNDALALELRRVVLTDETGQLSAELGDALKQDELLALWK